MGPASSVRCQTWAGEATVPDMTVLGLLIVLILVGVALYLVNQVIPMDAKIKTILNVVVVLLVLLWVLDAFVGFGHINLGRMKVC